MIIQALSNIYTSNCIYFLIAILQSINQSQHVFRELFINQLMSKMIDLIFEEMVQDAGLGFGLLLRGGRGTVLVHLGDLEKPVLQKLYDIL